MSHSGAAVEMAGKAIAVVAAIETAATALRVRVFDIHGVLLEIEASRVDCMCR